MSDEGDQDQRGREEEEEPLRVVVGVGGDGATAPALDSSHDSFGRGGDSHGDAVEDTSPVHEQQQQQQQQQQSLSSEKQPDEVASGGPTIPATGNVATVTTAVAAVGVDAEHTVAPGSSLPPVEAQEEGRVPDTETGNGTGGGGSISVGDGDIDDSVSGLPASGTNSTSIPPLAADNGAVVVAREETAYGTETTVGEEATATNGASAPSRGDDAPPTSLWGPSRTSEDKERLVDDITDKLLASLLKRALGTPAPPPPGGRTAAPEREDGQHDRPPAGHATGDALVDGEASEDEGIGSRRGPAMWEEPGTYEDTDDDDDDDEEEERDGADTREDWGTAAVTETYRSEEGMLMVVRDNGSDDSGGGGSSGGGGDTALGDSPEQHRKYQQPEQGRDAEEVGELGVSGQPPRSGGGENDDVSAAVGARLGDKEQDDDDDEYYFPPLTLARPK
ncbi:unnamed protein product, partial [Ectocarpus fasciculatus]